MYSTSTSELPFGSPAQCTYNADGTKVNKESTSKTTNESREEIAVKSAVNLPKEAKTFLRKAGRNLFVGFCKNNGVAGVAKILPDIYEVKVIHNEAGENIGVKIYFVDNSCEKAMVSGTDRFDLERGIEICMMKRILSFALEKSAGKSAKESGSALLAKVVEYGMKFYDEQEKCKIEAEKAKEEYESLEKRQVEKKRKKAEKRKAKKREEAIEIKKEAILRAYREMGVIGYTEEAEDVGGVPAQE